MSREWEDNFSNYGTDISNMSDGLYSIVDNGFVSLATDPDGISSGRVLKFNGGDNVRKVLSGPQTTVGVAQRVWFNALPAASGHRMRLLRFGDAVNAYQVGILIETTGAISAWRGDYATLLGTSSGFITANGWHHIEVKVVFSQAGGEVEIRLNGKTVLTLDSQDTCATANVEASQVCWDGDGYDTVNGPTWHMKDLYIWNGDGAVVNDFVGDVEIITIRPVSDIAFNWMASTGATGYNLIDKATPDDADYISADATPPAGSEFGLSDLPADVTSVVSLTTVARMRKTDGGDAKVQVSLAQGGTDNDGADRPITVADTYWTDTHELNGDTSAAWTRTEVNATTIKVNRTL